MSRKGTPADDAPIEYFHSLLKCEVFSAKEYHNSTNIVIDIVGKHIKRYNKTRIQQKLGYKSLVGYRKLVA